MRPLLNTAFIEVAIFLALFALIIFLGYFFSKKTRLLRKLRKRPAVPIQRVKENEYAKLTGKAKFVKEPLIAPLSGRSCVFYQILVERKNGKHGWSKVIDETKAVDFFLEAHGEMAIIKLQAAGANKNVYLHKDKTMRSGTFQDANHQLEAYLKSHGTQSTNWLGWNKTLRYYEGIIEPDEEIVVMGIGSWKALKEPIEGFRYSKVLTINGTNEHKLLLTDLEASVNESKK